MHTSWSINHNSDTSRLNQPAILIQTNSYSIIKIVNYDRLVRTFGNDPYLYDDMR